MCGCRGTLAKNVTDAGADFMTVICCATLPTMEAAQKEVKALQVELYGVGPMNKQLNGGGSVSNR